ncbi:2584_t:CDS:2, partial [Entrophospora sp. SA101]
MFQYAVFQDAFTIPTVVRPPRPTFRCLEAVCWAVLRHTCLRPLFQYAVFQYTVDYWSILGILEFSRLNLKLSVATIKDFKEDLYAILSKYKDNCNIHVNAKSKATKILLNFDSMFFTTEDQQENQIFIDQLQETSNSEKGKEHEKVTRPLDVEDDHSYKRQHKDEELSDPFEVLFDEEPSVEWEFDTPKPSWLDKIAHKRDSLIYNAFNCNDKRIQYELSLEPIWWKIIDLSDSKITTIITEYELSEINEKFSSLLEDWTTVEPAPESLLQSLEKLDNDQLRTIGEIVRPKGTYGAILELQKLLENKKEQKAPELNNLFGDEKDSNEIDKHKEISPLTVDDHTNSDVAFILDLIRFTGEVVSRASRNRRADAIDAPSNTEGYHLDWMFMCTGSKIEDTSKVFSNTLKVQKTLRDMHQNLIKVIFAEGGGTLSKLVLQA